jgi:hypothetical protein
MRFFINRKALANFAAACEPKASNIPTHARGHPVKTLILVSALVAMAALPAHPQEATKPSPAFTPAATPSPAPKPPLTPDELATLVEKNGAVPFVTSDGWNVSFDPRKPTMAMGTLIESFDTTVEKSSLTFLYEVGRVTLIGEGGHLSKPAIHVRLTDPAPVITMPDEIPPSPHEDEYVEKLKEIIFDPDASRLAGWTIFFHDSKGNPLAESALPICDYGVRVTRGDETLHYYFTENGNGCISQRLDK